MSAFAAHLVAIYWAIQLVAATQDRPMFINKKQSFDCIYIDFSEVFDRVGHMLRLNKRIALKFEAKFVIGGCLGTKISC